LDGGRGKLDETGVDIQAPPRLRGDRRQGR
jgi:hypothetical protein